MKNIKNKKLNNLKKNEKLGFNHIRTDNKVLTLNLTSLSKVEFNYFMFLLRAVQDAGLEPVEIDFKVIRSLFDIKLKTTNTDIFYILKRVSRKIASQVIEIETILENDESKKERITSLFNPFNQFDLYQNAKKLVFQIHPKFYYFFNDVLQNYSSARFSDLLQFRSKYSNLLYFKLYQFKKLKGYVISTKSLGTWLGLDISKMSAYHFKRDYLEKIKTDLNKVFINFDYKALKENETKKTSKITKYVFTWKGIKDTSQLDIFGENIRKIQLLENGKGLKIIKEIPLTPEQAYIKKLEKDVREYQDENEEQAVIVDRTRKIAKAWKENPQAKTNEFVERNSNYVKNALKDNKHILINSLKSLSPNELEEIIEKAKDNEEN